MTLFKRKNALFGWRVICLALWLTLASLPAHAARLAIVIGNDQYEHHSKLRKAGNDADAMAELLKRSGFTVINESRRRDLSRAQMNQVFSQLVQKVRREDEVVVFYSGHGLQYGDTSVITGKDFPKPFDRTLALSEGIQLKAWQETIRRAGARFALFVVDACREDITEGGLVKSMTGEDALFRTIQPTNPPEGQMVIFSVRSGQLALDRLSNADTNPNGVFTRIFLEEARKPGVSILDVVGETEERVAELAASVIDPHTGQPHRQKPALRNEAGQRVKFCFVLRNGQCGNSDPAPAPIVSQADPEQEAWELAKRRDTVAAYEGFLASFPSGRLAATARSALAGLKPASASTPTPQPTQPQATASAQPRAFKDCAGLHCPVMVVIAANSFMMGSNGGWADEKLPRRVTIRSFALGKHEVTQGQWKAVMGNENPSHFSTCGDNCPVERVSWDDIQIYIEKLNRMTGQQYRLPSEAEWEYAARAGCTSAFNVAGQCKDRIEPGEANFDGNYTYNGSSKGKSEGKTMAVGSFNRNTFGLHDMHGNVWEWVQDCYEDDYRKGQPVDGSAHRGNDSSCSTRVLRGGSWSSGPNYLRAANRVRNSPASRSDDYGFRLARMLP